jgi:hypothetical protein
MSSNLAKEWKNLQEARAMMKEMRKEMRELDSMMAIAWREVCQPANN